MNTFIFRIYNGSKIIIAKFKRDRSLFFSMEYGLPGIKSLNKLPSILFILHLNYNVVDFNLVFRL